MDTLLAVISLAASVALGGIAVWLWLDARARALRAEADLARAKVRAQTAEKAQAAAEKAADLSDEEIERRFHELRQKWGI